MAWVEVPLTTESISKGRKGKERAILDIKVTQTKHRGILKNLLPAHALSGCDTTACYFGIGKCTVIKVLKDGYDLSAVGNVDAPLLKVIAQATHFISACYGMKESRDMSHTRLLVWGKKAEKVTHFLPTWLPYHLRESRGFHGKCEEGKFSGSFMAINQRQPRAKPGGIWMEEGHKQTRYYAPLLYPTTQKRPLTTFWKYYHMWMQNWYPL